MALRVQVLDDHINLITGVAAKSNKPYELRVQDNVLITLHNGETRRINVTLGPKASPYKAGAYSLDVSNSVEVGKYGVLALARYPQIILIPA